MLARRITRLLRAVSVFSVEAADSLLPWFACGVLYEFPLGSLEPVEQATVTDEGVLVGPALVLPHPLNQEIESCILLLRGRVLLRLPRPRETVGDAGLGAGIEPADFGRPRQEELQEIGVAPFGNPFRIVADIGIDVPSGLGKRPSNAGAAPGKLIQIEVGDPVLTREAPSHGGFARAGVAKDHDAPHDRFLSNSFRMNNECTRARSPDVIK